MGIVFICISTPLDFEISFFGYTKSAHLFGVCLNFENSWFQEGGKHEDAGWTELITCLLDLCVSSFPSFNPPVFFLWVHSLPNLMTQHFSLIKKWGEDNLIHKSNASQVKRKKISQWLLAKKCFPSYITCCWFEMLPRRVCRIWNRVHDQNLHRKPFSTLKNSYEHLLIKRRWNRSIVHWFCKTFHSWRTTCSSLWNKYKVPKYLSRIVLQSDSPNSRFACTAV